MNVNEYDIVLDVLVVNQTSDTLQGLSLELATLGLWLCTHYMYMSTLYVYLPGVGYNYIFN